MSHLTVRGIITLAWQRLECSRFAAKAFCHYLLNRSLHTLVCLLSKPHFGQLVEVAHTLKRAIADEEVLFDIPNHALIFALGAGTIGPAGSRHKIVVARQVHKAF